MLIGHVLVTCPFVIGTVTGGRWSASTAASRRGRPQPRRRPLDGLQEDFTLRLIAPGVTAGAIFAFIISFGQFEIRAVPVDAQTSRPLRWRCTSRSATPSSTIAAAAGIYRHRPGRGVDGHHGGPFIDFRRLGAPTKK